MGTGLPSSWAPTPGVEPFTTLKKLVARYVLLPDDSDALDEAGDAINEAIGYLNLREWEWSKVSQDITLTGGTATYTLNTNFKKARSALLLNSSSTPRQRLDWEDPKILDTLEDNRTSQGQSRYYTAYNVHADGLVTLIPTPGTAFVTSYPTLRIRYYKRVGELAGNAEPDIPNEAQPFVIWYARAELAATHDQAKLGYATNRWQDIWRRLRANHARHHDWNERARVDYP